jgi:hypothetical protein
MLLLLGQENNYWTASQMTKRKKERWSKLFYSEDEEQEDCPCHGF